MNFALNILCSIFFLIVLSDLNYAGSPPYPPYYRMYPPINFWDSPEKACLADVGPITRGQHRFLGPKCQILYCPPDINTHEIIVILCEDYINKTNLPENFPDLERRMYLKICEYCKPVSPPIDLDLLELDMSTTPLSDVLPTDIFGNNSLANVSLIEQVNAVIDELQLNFSRTSTTKVPAVLN